MDDVFAVIKPENISPLLEAMNHMYMVDSTSMGTASLFFVFFSPSKTNIGRERQRPKIHENDSFSPCSVILLQCHACKLIIKFCILKQWNSDKFHVLFSPHETHCMQSWSVWSESWTHLCCKIILVYITYLFVLDCDGPQYILNKTVTYITLKWIF